ncbi:hypothetical protein AAZX31_15G152100 [Glycine max]|uniref:Trs120/TRAPPC9 N-terminal domain-containing protein n=1 Tax=Glycine soja TaxID=3848 RepID=A0A445GUG4_GLYSO|nr:protein NRT1/ PTR FAMILY 5.6-like isoform X2 [Glycine soja]RZB64832.1 hypothetical protein D0Y65_041063 [Glycine soja]
MIQVAVVPIGTVPSNVLRDYYSMLLPLHTIPLSAISSFYTEHQKSPFAVQPWDSGSLLFKFVLGGETPSPWEDFQSHRKTLAVIGIIHCPSSPDLDAVVDVFTNACKSEMNEITDSELPCRKAFSISHCEFNSDSDFKYCLEEPSILMLLLFSQKDHDIIRESTLDKVLGDKHQNSTTPGVLQEPAQTQSLSDISAKSVNYWVGTTTLMPLVGRFVADAYTGGFNMVIFSSLVYLMGLSLLILSQFIPSLKPSNNNQPRVVREVAFFLAIYCISLGTGGHKPCLESFGADQFDNDHWEERKKKMSFFNWWSFTVCFAMLLGATVVVYVQDFVSWGVSSLIITILMALTTIALYAGRPFYRYKQPAGNPFRPILQVLVAAIRKRNLSCPSNPTLLYEIPKLEKSQGRLLSHTSGLRFLDKAAIIEEKYVEQKDNAWRLATVTRVEETKLVLNVVPIWLTSLTARVCWAQASTLFVKQATTMNLKMTESFTLPPASLVSVAAILGSYKNQLTHNLSRIFAVETESLLKPIKSEHTDTYIALF